MTRLAAQFFPLVSIEVLLPRLAAGRRRASDAADRGAVAGDDVGAALHRVHLAMIADDAALGERLGLAAREELLVEVGQHRLAILLLKEKRQHTNIIYPYGKIS